MARRWPDGELPEFATTPKMTAAPANRVALER
jgi:hypothetical protein